MCQIFFDVLSESFLNFLAKEDLSIETHRTCSFKEYKKSASNLIFIFRNSFILIAINFICCVKFTLAIFSFSYRNFKFPTIIFIMFVKSCSSSLIIFNSADENALHNSTILALPSGLNSSAIV